MKLKYIIPVLFIALFAVSCSDDNESDPIINEVEGLSKIQDLVNATHTIELFNKTGNLKTGYNDISIRVKDNASNNYIQNATLSWMPVMQMMDMEHSCPKSSIAKALGKDTVYNGFIVFQMTNLDASGWTLTINYSIGAIEYSVSSTIAVNQNDNQNVTSFMASDNQKYIIALIEPKSPKIAINNLKVGLFKMQNMMDFPEVANFKITLDPRMPGMGNHSSPNNTDLSYNIADHMYHGNLSLTMTGYWVLNLKLKNIDNEVIKGEDVTTENTQSSLYLELEF